MTTHTITRAHLANAVYKETGISLGESGELVDAVFDEITRVLAQHEPVKISSFGTFNLRDKKARIGRNPKTGVEVVITPRTVLSFNPSNLLKDQINTPKKKK
jgi:integration host factor subunit alpha